MQKMMWEENEQKTYSNLFHSYLKAKICNLQKVVCNNKGLGLSQYLIRLKRQVYFTGVDLCKLAWHKKAEKITKRYNLGD